MWFYGDGKGKRILGNLHSWRVVTAYRLSHNRLFFNRFKNTRTSSKPLPFGDEAPYVLSLDETGISITIATGIESISADITIEETGNSLTIITGSETVEVSGPPITITPPGIALTIAVDTVIENGNVTQGNIKLSIVDGTAFVDFNSAGILTNRLLSKLTITDSADKKLTGYIKAAGSGETYGDNVLVNADFSSWSGDNPVGWHIDGEAGGNVITENPSDQCQIITAGPYIAISQDYLLPPGALGKITLDIKDRISGAIALESNVHIYPNIVWESIGDSQYFYYTDWGDQRTYLKRGYGGEPNNITIDNVILNQVLTPSSTGVMITSIINGSIYNWISEESGFNRNDSSGYTYSIEIHAINVSGMANISETGNQLIIITGSETVLFDYSLAETGIGLMAAIGAESVNGEANVAEIGIPLIAGINDAIVTALGGVVHATVNASGINLTILNNSASIGTTRQTGAIQSGRGKKIRLPPYPQWYPMKEPVPLRQDIRLGLDSAGDLWIQLGTVSVQTIQNRTLRPRGNKTELRTNNVFTITSRNDSDRYWQHRRRLEEEEIMRFLLAA